MREYVTLEPNMSLYTYPEPTPGGGGASLRGRPRLRLGGFSAGAASAFSRLFENPQKFEKSRLIPSALNFDRPHPPVGNGQNLERFVLLSNFASPSIVKK